MKPSDRPGGRFLCMTLRTYCLVIGYICLFFAITVPVAPYAQNSMEEEKKPVSEIYKPRFTALLVIKMIRLALVSGLLLYGVYKDNSIAVLSWIAIVVYWRIYGIFYDPVNVLTADKTNKQKLEVCIETCVATVVGFAAIYYVHRYYILMTKPS